LSGKSGLLNAPTGSGKTYALWIPAVLELINDQNFYKKPAGLRIIWITPLRALAKDIQRALQLFLDESGLKWDVDIRTGDTPVSQRNKQLKSAPTCLITTPESLHILFSQAKSTHFFKNINSIIVDEWHELLSTKRGVQTELSISRIKNLSQYQIKIWGISATIGNLDEALNVLLGNQRDDDAEILKAQIEKKTQIKTIMPDKIERFPWHGHLGLKLLAKILPIIEKSKYHSSIYQYTFTNRNVVSGNSESKTRIRRHNGDAPWFYR
jgi:ATP-dependent Lhr-like helicase